MEIIKDSGVVVVSAKQCNNCEIVKKLLTLRNISYEELDIDNLHQHQIDAIVEKANNVRKLPLIFVDGVYVSNEPSFVSVLYQRVK